MLASNWVPVAIALGQFSSSLISQSSNQKGRIGMCLDIGLLISSNSWPSVIAAVIIFVFFFFLLASLLVKTDK